MVSSNCQMCAVPIELRPVVRTTTEDGTTQEFTTDYNNARRLFPSELDLIHLTKFEYSLNKFDTCIHAYEKRMRREGEDSVVKCCAYMHVNDWILLEKFYQETRNPFSILDYQGQFGAAFFNTKSKQLVIVHRGTSVKNISSIRADWKEIVSGIVGKFGCRAYLYTKSVIERYGIAAESITVVGHSLGGWLAQVSAFYMQNPEFLDKLLYRSSNLRPGAIQETVKLDVKGMLSLRLNHVANSFYKHAHCVSFDGPGCKEAFEIIFPGRPKYEDDRRVEQLRIFDSLDVSVYFCDLDCVNMVNEQIGSVFHIKVEPGVQTAECGKVSQWSSIKTRVWQAVPFVANTAEWYTLYVSPHSCVNILDFWIQYDEQIRNPQKKVLAHVFKVTDWPVKIGFTEIKAAATREEYARNFADIVLDDSERDFKRFRISCFNRDERQSIETAIACKRFYQSQPVWTGRTTFCVRFLASDADSDYAFELQNFDQILQLSGQHDLELFRDFFIRKMKFHVRQFKALSIRELFPDYLEVVYISRTEEYVKTLPRFSNENPGCLAFIPPEFSGAETCVISVRTEKEDSRICTGKIYQLVQQPYLEVQKQYLVVSTYHLSRMESILNSDATGAAFLPDLTYMIIECISEYDVPLVNQWIDKLCDSAGDKVRKIVVVIPPSPVSEDAVSLAGPKYQLSQADRRSLREGLDILSLMKTQTLEFKLQGRFYNLSEFFSGAGTEAGQLADSTTSAKEKLLALFPEENQGSIPQQIYSILEKGYLGALLPQLDGFEEAYFLRRTYQDIAIKSYSSKKDVFVVCVDSRTLAPEESEYLNTFIRQQHKDPSAVLCQKVFVKLPDAAASKEGWEEFCKSCQEHKFVRVVHECGKSIWPMQKALNEHQGDQGLKGHIVQLKDYVPPDPKNGHDKVKDKDTDTDKFKLVWLCSFGKIEMSTITKQEIGPYDYELLAEGTQRLTMIADEPGMGKTIVMQKLAIMSQRGNRGETDTAGSPNYTIFIELGNVSQILRRELSKEVSLPNVVKALSEIESVHQKQIIGAILTHLLKQEGKVRLFLDGLDEIDDDLRAIVLEMVDILLLESEARIHIAFRDRLLSELQERFKAPCLKLMKFTTRECVEFLSNYWQKHSEFNPLQFMKSDLVQVYIKDFLQCFEAKLGTEAKKFIGIPFQLRLLAAAYMRDPFFKFYDEYANSEQIPDREVLLNQKLLPEFTDLAGLYKLFIETKIREAFKEKYGLDLDTQKEFLKEKGFKDEIWRIHRIAGFDKIFCVEQRVQISNEDVRPTRGQTEALHACGIVSHYKPNDAAAKNKSDDTEFVHQTLAEYFAAEFIFGRIFPQIAPADKDNVQRFLDSYLFLSRYENVLNFLNMIILESAPQVLKWATDPHANCSKIVQLFKAPGDECRQVDCLKRNFMHYVIMYSKSWLGKSCQGCHRYRKSLFLLLDDELLKKQDMFDATPFAYIFGNRDFVYRGMDGTTIAFSNLLLNTNLHFELESRGESTAGYGGSRGDDDWDRKSAARNYAYEFLRKYGQSGYELSVGDWRALEHLSENCTCVQFPEPNHELIVQTINQNAKYLNDVQIELRRNSSSLAYCVNDIDRPDKPFMEFALGLEGESRVVFLCELEREIKSEDRKSFRYNLVELLKENKYEHYKRAANYLHVDRASGLLEMFRGEVEPDQIEESLKRDIFSAWAATEFTSLRDNFQGRNCLTGHFERFCMFTPKFKGQSFPGNEGGRGGKMLLKIVKEWLQTTKPGYHDREEKLACLLPMLWLVLDLHEFTEFVREHEVDIAAIDEKSISSIASSDSIRFYKTLGPKLRECLQDAGETGQTLLDKIKDK